MLPLCFFPASRYCLKQFNGQIVKSLRYAWNFISLICFLGPDVFRNSLIRMTQMFSDRSRFLMPNNDDISPHLWPHSNTNSVASFWLRYFKLLVSILEMRVLTIPISHVKLNFERAGLLLKTPFMNLVVTGCWPTGTPSILINGEKEDCAVFITLSNPTLK